MFNIHIAIPSLIGLILAVRNEIDITTAGVLVLFHGIANTALVSEYTAFIYAVWYRDILWDPTEPDAILSIVEHIYIGWSCFVCGVTLLGHKKPFLLILISSTISAMFYSLRFVYSILSDSRWWRISPLSDTYVYIAFILLYSAMAVYFYRLWAKSRNEVSGLAA